MQMVRPSFPMTIPFRRESRVLIMRLNWKVRTRHDRWRNGLAGELSRKRRCILNALLASDDRHSSLELDFSKPIVYFFVKLGAR